MLNDADDNVKRFNFLYDYFDANPALGGTTEERKRLKLLSVSEQNSTQSLSLPPWAFTYEATPLPPRNSRAQDYWGFANGQTNNDAANGMFVGIHDQTIDANGGNREPDSQFSKACILNKITYPTGGETVFDYEGHGLHGQIVSNAVPYSRAVTDTYTLANEQETTTTNTQDFTLHAIENIQPYILYGQLPVITYTFQTDPNNAAKGTVSITKLNDIANNSDDVVVYSANINSIPPVGSTQIQGSAMLPLTIGSYRISVKALLPGTIASATINWLDTDEYQPAVYDGDIPVGGLRIKRITSKAGISSGQPDVVKRYEYKTEIANISSGKLFQKFKAYAIRPTLHNFPSTVENPSILCWGGNALYRYNDNQLAQSLTQGSHIGYSEVLEKNGGNAENGGIRYFYTATANNVQDIGEDAYPFAPKTSYDHRRGILLQKKIYKAPDVSGNLQVLQKQLYNYEFVNHQSIDGMVLARTKAFLPTTSNFCNLSLLNNLSLYITRNSSVVSEWVRLQSETQTTYDENGQNPITATTNYYYEDNENHIPTHLQPTRTQQILADGTIYETRTTYPTDYFNTNSTAQYNEAGVCTNCPEQNAAATTSANPVTLALKGMVQKHIHNAPIEVLQYRNGKITDGTLNEYKDFGASGGGLNLYKQYSLVLPEDALNEARPIDPITDVFVRSFITTSPYNFTKSALYQEDFSLGYNSMGKISSYTRPKSGEVLSFAWFANGLLQSKTISGCDQSLDGTDALITRYEYHPLFSNVSKITDPNNRETRYSYDTFGRLTQVNYHGDLSNINTPERVQDITYHYALEAPASISLINPAKTFTPTATANYVCVVDRNQVANVTYFDGLGREVQKVGVRQAGDNTNDLVVPIVYDAFGRQPIQYLPYAATSNAGKYRTTALADQSTFYVNGATNGVVPITAANNAYSQTRFEASPLNRIMEQAAPGASWKMGAGHTTQTHYNLLNSSPFYLSYTQTTDENGNTTTQYKDLLNRPVLNLEADNTSGTYYYYNALDKLSEVTSPAGTYAYRYDGKGRLISKVVPGAQPELYIYDQLDRLVLQQDGNMRTGKKWLYTKYDCHNRPTETGIYTNTNISYAALQTIFDNAATYDEFANLPLTNPQTQILTRTFYNQIGNFKGQIEHTEELILDQTSTISPTNQINTYYTYDNNYRPLTKRNNNHLGGLATLEQNSTIYDYDTFGNTTSEILKHTTLYSNGTYSLNKTRIFDPTNRLSTVINNTVGTLRHTYNAIGQLNAKQLHSLYPWTNYLQTLNYSYNERGWLKATNQANVDAYNDIFAEVLSYDLAPAGTGATTRFNGDICAINVISCYPTTADLTTATQLTFKYAYDNRNRLTAATTLATVADAYSETFTYDPAGNITALMRKGKKSNGTYGLVDNLTYTYGANNQVLNVTDAITDASTNSNDFRDGTPNNTDDYAYDNNGNLIIDQNKGIGIAYNYLNLPQTIVTSTQVMHFAYTATGTKLQKKICIRSGLPMRLDSLSQVAQQLRQINPNPYNGITSTPPPSVSPLNNYNTVATTLQNIKNTGFVLDQFPVNVAAYIDQLSQSYTTCNNRHDYIGNIEYQTNSTGTPLLEAVYTEEGRINLQTGYNNRHEYNIKDHLGNTRVCFTPPTDNTTTPWIIQQTNYYAYGLPIKNLTTTYNTPLVGGTPSLVNRYQYNGKEFETDLGLMWNDYGARWYDPQRSVWGQIDPLAEKYAAWSGYNYVLNNPIKLLDKDGRKPDNYYRNQRGDLLAVVRTNDTQDNFYTVKNDNKVSLTATHEKDPAWSASTDQEKLRAVNLDQKTKFSAQSDKVNSEGLKVTEQALVAPFLIGSGAFATGATTTPATGTGAPVAVITGAATLGTATVIGAIASPNPTPGFQNARIITTADPVNPGGAPANQVVPQGSLPTPNSGESVPLPPNSLPANLTKPTYNDSRQDGTRIITDNNGLIPKE